MLLQMVLVTKILLSNCLLLVYRNKIDYSMLALQSVTMLYSVICHSDVSCDKLIYRFLRIFQVHKHPLAINCFTSFFWIRMCFILFLLLLYWLRSLLTILILILRGKHCLSSLTMMLAVDFLQMPFIRLKKFFSILPLLTALVMNGCRILSHAFSASIKIITFFFLLNIKLSLHSQDKLFLDNVLFFLYIVGFDLVTLC